MVKTRHVIIILCHSEFSPVHLHEHLASQQKKNSAHSSQEMLLAVYLDSSTTNAPCLSNSNIRCEAECFSDGAQWTYESTSWYVFFIRLSHCDSFYWPVAEFALKVMVVFLWFPWGGGEFVLSGGIWLWSKTSSHVVPCVIVDITWQHLNLSLNRFPPSAAWSLQWNLRAAVAATRMPLWRTVHVLFHRAKSASSMRT